MEEINTSNICRLKVSDRKSKKNCGKKVKIENVSVWRELSGLEHMIC